MSDGEAPAPGAPQRFDIAATLEEVSRFVAFFGTLLPRRMPADQRHGVELAVGEALVNIVKHGRPAAMAPIRIEWVDEGSLLRVSIHDAGHPIPREKLEDAAAAAFDLGTCAIESLPEGGMGLPLIHMVFDEVDYVSGADGNRLLLVQHIRGP
jgi:serine/threonine-protein kinase RsbW